MEEDYIMESSDTSEIVPVVDDVVEAEFKKKDIDKSKKFQKLKPGQKREEQSFVLIRNAQRQSKSRIVNRFRVCTSKLRKLDIEPVEVLVVVHEKKTEKYKYMGFGSILERFKQGEPLTNGAPKKQKQYNTLFPSQKSAKSVEVLTPDKYEYSFTAGAGQNLALAQREKLLSLGTQTDGAKEISLRVDPTLKGRGKAGTSGISRGIRGRNCRGKVRGRGRGRGTKRRVSTSESEAVEDLSPLESARESEDSLTDKNDDERPVLTQTKCLKTLFSNESEEHSNNNTNTESYQITVEDRMSPLYTTENLSDSFVLGFASEFMEVLDQETSQDNSNRDKDEVDQKLFVELNQETSQDHAIECGDEDAQNLPVELNSETSEDNTKEDDDVLGQRLPVELKEETSQDHAIECGDEEAQNMPVDLNSESSQDRSIENNIEGNQNLPVGLNPESSEDNTKEDDDVFGQKLQAELKKEVLFKIGKYIEVEYQLKRGKKKECKRYVGEIIDVVDDEPYVSFLDNTAVTNIKKKRLIEDRALVVPSQIVRHLNVPEEITQGRAKMLYFKDYPV